MTDTNEFAFGYREVVPDQTLPEKWKEIILNTGGSQSTLQDIKVPERAGGYSYKDSTKHFTRNRFIYWRISHDVLELVEQSLDVNLTNCRVRYKFVDTPILDGISIHETTNTVVILVVTVYSIYKLVFPHPEKLHRQEYLLASHPDLSVQSIFSEATAQSAKDFHVIPNARTINSPVPHAAASWLVLPQEEALFALAYSSGTILLLRLDTLTNLLHSTELKQDSLVPRFLSGIATAFRGKGSEGQVPMALLIHSCGNDTYLFALCREGNVRMWSCNKAQCIAVSDVSVDGRVASQGAQGHILRKTVGVHDNELYLATYLKYSSDCEFNILKPIQESGIIKFIRLCSLHVPDQHIVDFSFTTERLWAVWKTADMDNVAVTHAQLNLSKNQVNTEWETVILEQPPDKDYIASDPGTDPRQAYINYIFHPGQFSLSDITRALSIYRRTNIIADMTLSPAVLKEKVCATVEAEIQAEVMDYEMMDDDYLEIANRCWSRFYSCVIQYHANGSKPVGLLILPNVGGVALLKKSIFSLLRPMQALEHLMLANDKCQSWRFKSTPILNEDENICQDVVKLMLVIVTIEEQLQEEVKSAIEKEFYRLNSPDLVIDEMISRMLLDSDDPLWDSRFQSFLVQKLSNINNISSAMSMLLRVLVDGLSTSSKSELEVNQNASKMFVNVSHLFSSQLGISAVSETVAQIAILRFSICRNLLILQKILLSGSINYDMQKLNDINLKLAPRTVVLTQAYYAIMWICESNASCAPTQALLENSSQRLAVLKLIESRANIVQRQQRSLSLLELFIQSIGSKHVHKLMAQPNFDLDNVEQWHNGMLGNVMLVMRLIWPITGSFIFPEWLLSSCQFLLVQEYVRLLNKDWCEWNSASRKFILAVSLLEMGETEKATDYFLYAANGILNDSFLNRVCLNDDVSSESSANIYYYLKVIELLDQHSASDCIIEVAEIAISKGDKNDPNLPTLYSIVFSQHLNLSHYNEAYNYLHLNPDAERKKDCLRQLVVTLFERKKFADLVAFPYTDMFEDLVRIVEARARSADITKNHYYDFLYSFHVDKQIWRKAASAKYEQAMRYSQEGHSVKIITKQWQCLLTCINALSLVNEKYRWIVRPTMEESFANDERQEPKVKRSLDGKEVLHYKVKKQIDVLEIDDIRKEYAIVQAKLKLSKRNSELHIVAQAGPSELISMIANVNLYTDALNLCDKFNISKDVVLEHLASQCVRLTHQEDQQAWDWLVLNEVSELHITTNNVATVSWALLEKLIVEHEKPQLSELHKAVVKKLIDHGTFFPQWLLTSYKKRNAAELLRLLLNVGRLIEATDLANEYIMALLGKGMENFNLETPLISTGPPVWLPLNTIERLLFELKHAGQEDETYNECYTELNKNLKHYINTVERVSENMIKLKMKNSCR